MKRIVLVSLIVPFAALYAQDAIPDAATDTGQEAGGHIPGDRNTYEPLSSYRFTAMPTTCNT